MIIEREVVKEQASERDLKLMDSLMSHLKYFKCLSQQQKEDFFCKCSSVTFQAQQLIFEEGDIGDYMYIILKGKVNVHIRHPKKQDISDLIASPSDGEVFGELSLFDFNKIHTASKEEIGVINEQNIEQNQERTNEHRL